MSHVDKKLLSLTRSWNYSNNCEIVKSGYSQLTIDHVSVIIENKCLSLRVYASHIASNPGKELIPKW